jgi:hypothetical protein
VFQILKHWNRSGICPPFGVCPPFRLFQTQKIGATMMMWN